MVCFSVREPGQIKVRLITRHQDGGYGKSYYVLPYSFLFNQKNQLVKAAAKSKLRQTVGSGDYVFEETFSVEKNQSYYLVVASYNLHPDLPWSSYPNYGIGVVGELFPINVYSSIYGVVNVEIALKSICFDGELDKRP